MNDFFPRWTQALETKLARRLRVSDLDKVEALESILKEDPEYILLSASANSLDVFEKAQDFHSQIHGSGIATIRVLVEDQLARYVGNGKIVPTPAGRKFLAEVA